MSNIKNHTFFRFSDIKQGGYIDFFSIGDSRGGFNKIYEKDIYYENGIDFTPNEVFVTTSAKNVIRGIHFQLNKPQTKIVSVISGSVYDVIVDLRPDSKTFKKWWGYELDEDKHKAVFVPKGFGHGFLSLRDDTRMLYICSGEYDKDTDTGIIYNDSDLNIIWPVDDLNVTIHSARDMSLMSLKEYLNKPMQVSGR